MGKPALGTPSTVASPVITALGHGPLLMVLLRLWLLELRLVQLRLMVLRLVLLRSMLITQLW